MKRLMLALLVAAPLSASLAAQPVLPDAAAVELALDNHPEVMAANARADAARAQARAMAAGSHEFIAGASLLNRRVDREGDYSEYDASLTRAVRLPGKAGLDRKAGDAGVLFAENMAEDARHQAAVSLNDHWWDWVGAASERAILDEAVAALGQTADAVKRRLALRDASALEADQADAALALAQSAARSASGREEAARVALAARFPGLTLPARAPALSAPQVPAEGLTELGAHVVARSHEIGAAVAQADQAGLLAERSRRDRFADPSIGIRGFSERNGAERGVGLLFSIPLGGGNRGALADQARAQATAAEAQAVAIRQQISALAGRDVATASAAYAAWQDAHRAAQASASAAARAGKGHALGGLDLSDRLYVQRLAQEAALAEVVASAEAWRAITRLRIDSHTLWIHAD
jgi:outer membrane protein TolC